MGLFTEFSMVFRNVLNLYITYFLNLNFFFLLNNGLAKFQIN